MATTNFHVTGGSSAADTNGGGPSLGTNDAAVDSPAAVTAVHDGSGVHTLTDDGVDGFSNTSVDDFITWDTGGTPEAAIVTSLTSDDIIVVGRPGSSVAFTNLTSVAVRVGGAFATVKHAMELIDSTFVNAAGDVPKVNIKNDGTYSEGATTLLAGTMSVPVIYSGYTSSISDLDDQGRNSTGFINTTNFPAITFTGSLTPAAFVAIQNLKITGALSAYLILSATVDNFSVVNCEITNTQNNASAGAVRADNQIRLIGSDFYCSGAAHAIVVDLDTSAGISDCRFRGTSSSALLQLNTGEVHRSVFWGDGGTPTAILLFSAIPSALPNTMSQNTFYSVGACIQTPNSAPIRSMFLSHNHATDSTKWIENLYSATANLVVYESYNRLRDITTPRTGVVSIEQGEILTDTGGIETDYEDAANGDFHLIAAAPGYGKGLHGQDIGANQHVVPSGGGGAGGRGYPRGAL